MIHARYSPERAPEVRAFAEEIHRADGYEAFGEQTLFNLTSLDATHVLFLNREAGAVVGYAQVDRGSAELAVHPGHRRRGLGAMLLDAVKTDDPAAAVWAHGDLPAARALAASRGLRSVRELVYMTADLTATPVPPVPAGLTISTYTPEDAADWLALNAEAFADHPEQGRLTLDDLEERTATPWFDPEVFWLARDEGGQLLGYMWVKREVGSAAAEIYVLGVSPAAQGRGLGAFLTGTALGHMHDAGVKMMDLYVEGDNLPALATYARYGFTRAVTHVQYR